MAGTVKPHNMSFCLCTTIALVLLLFSSQCRILSAQNNPIAADYISIEQGLSQSSVSSVIQDKHGFMWFGTQDGLNRYDGYSFKIYRNLPADSASICNNYILDVISDRTGRLWIATSQGLAVYDDLSDRFTCFYAQPGTNGALPDNYIRVLKEDRRGYLWIGTSEGLSVYDPNLKTFSAIPVYANRGKQEIVLSLLEDSHGHLWIGFNDGNVFQLDISDISRVRILHRFNQWNHSERTINNNIWTIYEDRRHNLWLGTEHGLFLYDSARNSWTGYKKNISDPASLTDNSVRQILEDRYGNLWIGTNRGLDQYDRQTGRFRHFRSPYSINPVSRNDRIRRIFEDHHGRLWIGTDGEGLIKLDYHKYKFGHLRHEPGNKASLNHSMVLCINEDLNQTLWVGTLGGGLNRFDRKTNRWTFYQNNPSNPGSISDNNVRALEFDRQGKLWIGTLQGGLNCFDPALGTFTRYLHQASDRFSLGNNAVTCLLADRDGDLWIGTYNGLNRYDPGRRRFTRFHQHDHDSNSLSHNQIRTMYEDSSGQLWIGTFGGGLNRLNKSTGRFTSYRYRPADPASLTSDIIRSIHRDRRGRLWIGTDQGLNLLDPESGICRRFNDNTLLPNNVIYAIQEDFGGYLWMSTNNGLARFHPDTLIGNDRSERLRKHVRHYTLSDGLQSLEFNQNSSFMSEQGEMFFGGINGLNYFFPDRIIENEHLPPVVWTDFKIFNESVAVPGNICFMKRIELSYNDNYFTIGFAALDFTDPGRNRYSYKMEGFDKEWIDAGTRRFAGYTNLDGGQYVFRVRGSNNDGVWNEQGISMTIIIIPPWWQQWWFRLLIVCFAVAAVYFVFRIRTRMILTRNRQLEALVADRTNDLKAKTIRLEEVNTELLKLNEKKNEFLGIAAHDIRNPLGIIISFAKVILQDIHRGSFRQDEAKQDLHNIVIAAEQSRKLVNALLDITAIESGKVNLELHQEDMATILEECGHRHIKHAQQKKINLDIARCDDLPLITVDRTRITEVMDNLVSNALKFTYPGGRIRVYCESGPGEIVTHVQDNGQGLNERDLQEIFNSFKKLSARPTGGESSTGLGLAIVKKIVELHGGQVWVESRYGEGSTFSFSLPIDKNH